MIDSIKPTEILSKYIQNYFIVEVDDSIDFLPKERVYPTGNATMVLHYGNPSKFQKLNSSEYIEPKLVICGKQTNYYDVSLSGKTGMILIVFKPHGVKSFFNISITEILNKNISLQNLANNDFKRIEYAVELIGNSKGQIKTHDIAIEVCLGIKQFERVFSKNVGINPKKYASIVRLQNVIQLKRKHNNISMSQLAYDSGFFDHAHFIHDFKGFTGLSPKEFFSELK
jgi:AraC-like DNA-binding protein